jgi:hypothetical protein
MTSRPRLLSVAGACVAVGALAAVLAVQAAAQPSANVAAAKYPKPVVSPGVVSPGGRITVRGVDCTSSEYVQGVDVSVVTASGAIVASGATGHSGIHAGRWSVALKIPAATKPKNYLVASSCDLYSKTVNYPAVTLPVRAPAKITLSGPHSVRSGRPVTLTLRMTSAGRAVGAQHVVLYARPAHTKSFVRQARLTTSRSGNATLHLRPKKTTTYRAVLPNGAVYLGATATRVVQVH